MKFSDWILTNGVCLHLSYACAPYEQIQLLTDMVSSQMRESQALNNGCTLAAYPCRWAAVRGIRARVVSFNNIHRSDHAFVVAAMYSAVSESAAWSDPDRFGRTASS